MCWLNKNDKLQRVMQSGNVIEGGCSTERTGSMPLEVKKQLCLRPNLQFRENIGDGEVKLH